MPATAATPTPSRRAAAAVDSEPEPRSAATTTTASAHAAITALRATKWPRRGGSPRRNIDTSAPPASTTSVYSPRLRSG